MVIQLGTTRWWHYTNREKRRKTKGLYSGAPPQRDKFTLFGSPVSIVSQLVKLTLRTQSGIVWVLGERWWVLMTMTVMMMEAMTNTMVNSMYFPMRGTALEVEGISSTMTSRNTVRDSRTEMLRVIFSPGGHSGPRSLCLLWQALYNVRLVAHNLTQQRFHVLQPWALKQLLE